MRRLLKRFTTRGGGIVASGKPSLLFVGHIRHKRPRSFDFLIDTLKQSFDVTPVWVDPARKLNFKALDTAAEYVLLAGLEFLAPFFIAASKRVVVVPLYDVSADLPDTHYVLNRQARVLNLSVSMHARTLAHEMTSHLMRYAPDPEAMPQQMDFGTTRAVFWQRQPHGQIDLSAVRQMLAGQLDGLHVHTPADDGQAFNPDRLEGFDCPVTTSDWSKDPGDFEALLDGANIFVAPRRTEGLGHSMLAAMARGMVVIASDRPTHNEYITHGLSGLLYDDPTTPVDLRGRGAERLARLGANARLAMKTTYQAWQAGQDGLLGFVLDTPKAQVPHQPDVTPTLHSIMAAYPQGLGAYKQMLDSTRPVGQILSRWDQVEEALHKTGHSANPKAVPRSEVFFFGYNSAQPILGRGWSLSEAALTWAVEHTATLNIPLSLNRDFTRLEIEARSIAECDLSVIVNGTGIGKMALNGMFQRKTFKLSRRYQQKGLMRIALCVDPKQVFPNVEPRPLKFALKSLTLGL